MKTKPTMLKLLILLCGTFLTTAVFGQTTFIFTNQANATFGEIGNPINWNPNGIPNPNSGAPGDTMQFDEQTVGAISMKADTNMNGGSSGSAVGLQIYLDANQVDNVNFSYPNSSFNGTSMRTASITVDPGAGTLSLGNSNSLTSALYIVGGGVNGQIHEFLNNSANPVIIYPAMRLAYGGGGAHTINFDGTGNWYVTNSLMAVNGSQTIVVKSGTGTMIWQYADTPVVVINSQLQGPLNINAGTLIVDSGNLLNNLTGSQNMLNNGTLFEYDGQTNALGSVANGTISLSISGTGPLQVNNGVLTLAGENTYTGNTILTGGELIAGSVESTLPAGPLGEPSPLANTISFQGGTLGYSAFNGYDYSPRFSTAPGQLYSIDTASANVTFTNGLTSSGGTLTKLGGGSLTLAGADTYSGLTTVSSGKLVLAGTAGNGNINVADNAAIGVVENGTPFTPNTLTLGTLNGAIFEANNVTNKNAAPMQPVNLASAGLTTVNVNSGRFRLIGDTFPLLAWSSGTAPGTSLGFLSGAGGHLVTNGQAIDVVIDQPPYLWTGANGGTWVAGGPINWTYSGNATAWANGNYALFDDSLSLNPSVTISGVVSGKTITFNNVNTNYTITSPDASDNLGGSSSLTLGGSGTLTLSGGQNTYTGVTTISGGGTLIVGALANGGTPSDIGASVNAATNLVFNNGTLQYTGGGATIDRLFSLGTGGGTINNAGGGALTFNNSGPMGLVSSGPRTLTLQTVNTSGGGDVLGIAVGDGGGPTALVLDGPGNWTLTGTNSYSGGTTLVAGELFVGNGGSTGSLGISGANDATTIDFKRTGTVTVLGPVIGAGTVILDGSGTVILANDNLYSGGTTINNGTLQLGNGGGPGSLNTGGTVVNDSLLTFNSTGTHILNGVISGTGNVIVGGGGFEQLLGANTYTGWTLVNAGTIFQPCTGNQGALASSAITNNGIVRFDRQDTGVFIYTGPIVGSGSVQNNANNFNAGNVNLTGINTYTGGTYIGDNILTFGDNINGDGTFVGNVTFTNNFSTSDDNQRELEINIANNFTISGNIVTNFASTQANLGIVQLSGSGTVTLTGNNTYGGGTIVSNGSLVIGTGTTGSVGTGPVSISNSTPLLINIGNTLNIPGTINGTGVNVVSIGSGTVLLNGTANTYTGTTTVSNGGFFINGANMASSDYVTNATFGGWGTLSEPVTLDAHCTLEPRSSPVFSGYAPRAPVGTLTINNNLSLNGPNYVFAVNKDLSPAQSNDMVVVSGTLSTTTTVGTLTVHNLGQTLKAGDTFTLFNKPLPNGNNVTVTGARATWINNLALNGSITVASVLGSPVTLNVANQYQGTSTNKLSISWSDPYGTDNLLVQTNKLNVGLTTNWYLYPGGGTSPVIVPIVRTNPSVFFILVEQP